MDLFARDYKLVIGFFGLGLEIKPPMQIEFSISKSLKPTPHKAQIRVANLNREHRRYFEHADDKGPIPVQLDAGYAGNTSTILLAEMNDSYSERDGADYWTVFTCGEAIKALQTSRINKSFAPGVTTDTVFREVAKALGVKSGNLDSAVSKIKTAFAGSGNRFPRGCVWTGSATDEMTAICRSLGLEWSIQNGALQILEKRKALETTAVWLSKRTGMIDKPSVDGKGVYTVKSLMQPNLFPGRQIRIDGEFVKALIRAEDTQHAGSFRGDSWHVEIKGKKVGT